MEGMRVLKQFLCAEHGRATGHVSKRAGGGGQEATLGLGRPVVHLNAAAVCYAGTNAARRHQRRSEMACWLVSISNL